MSLIRWMPTFLAFPFAAALAMLAFGQLGTPGVALAHGAVIGAVVGSAQWLALGRRAGWRWAVGTTIGCAAGSVASSLTVGAPTERTAAIVTGLITGTLVGAAQGLAFRRGTRVTVLWLVVTAVAWAAGWSITSAFPADLDRGYAAFGPTGALFATALTGGVLRLMLGPPDGRAPADPSSTTPVMRVASSIVAATGTRRADRHDPRE